MRAAAIVGGVNVLLGVPGVVPVWLAWFFLSSWPLAAMGLTDRPPTENDGVAVASVVILPVIAVSALAWFLVGRAARRRVDATGDAPWFWPLSAVASLVPTLVLITVSLAS